MTFRDLTNMLAEAGIDNAAHEAALLAEHYTTIPALMLRADAGRDLPDPGGALRHAALRRAAHYPLQYLIGTWSFWRQEYEVSPDCLIPRPDTEVLVDYAARHLPRGGRVIDLCTGSGCIAISLLCERPDLTAVAVDLFDNTLAMARRNAARNGLSDDRLTLMRGDVLSGDFMAGLGTFDAVLSNPPYITTQAMKTLAPELSYEPEAALWGGEDGLIFYRRMLDEPYRSHLSPGACYLFEIGYDQGDALRALASERGDAVEIHRDLGGQDRLAVVRPTHTL